MAGTFLYAIVPAGRLPELDLAGLDDEPLRRVAHGEVEALASDAPPELLGARRELRRHAEVIEEALRHTTVVPMGFGVVFPDDDAVVADLLGPREADLLALLTRLEGRIEVRVRGYYDEDSVLAEVVTEDPRLQAAATGLNERIRLGERIAEALEVKREADAQHLLRRLEPFALDTARRPPATEMTVIDAAFLVDRDGLERFDAAVGALGGEIAERVRLKYVGPLPPATFVDLELPAEAT